MKIPIALSALTGWNRRVGNVCHVGGAAGNVRYNMRVLTQPTVASNFEEIGTFARVGNQNPSQEITSMRGHVFGEGERRGDDVFVQKIDVVTIRVGRVVVEWQIAC